MNHHVGPWRKRKTGERKNEDDMVFLLLWHQTWQLILIGTCPSSHKKADATQAIKCIIVVNTAVKT